MNEREEKDPGEVLEDDESPFHTIPGPNSTWVAIAKLGTEEEARIIQGYLQAEGIPCQVEVVKFTMEPVNFGKMSEVRLYVAAESESAALDLLRRHDELFASESDSDMIITDEGPADIQEEDVAEPDPEESSDG